jgi:hypothetical protein
MGHNMEPFELAHIHEDPDGKISIILPCKDDAEAHRCLRLVQAAPGLLSNLKHVCDTPLNRLDGRDWMRANAAVEGAYGV